MNSRHTQRIGSRGSHALARRSSDYSTKLRFSIVKKGPSLTVFGRYLLKSDRYGRSQIKNSSQNNELKCTPAANGVARATRYSTDRLYLSNPAPIAGCTERVPHTFFQVLLLNPHPRPIRRASVAYHIVLKGVMATQDHQPVTFEYCCGPSAAAALSQRKSPP